MKKLLAFGSLVVLMSLVEIFAPRCNVEQAKTNVEFSVIGATEPGEILVWNKEIGKHEWQPSPDTSTDVMVAVESCKHEFTVACCFGGCGCTSCLQCGKQLVEPIEIEQFHWQLPPEPNDREDEILICPDHYRRYCKICESVYYKGGWIIPFKSSYLYNQALQEKPEPNEPTLTFGEATMSMPFKENPLDFIPTWPEYIELDKVLRIEYPNQVYPFDQYIEFPKGTKIYFKEDE